MKLLSLPLLFLLFLSSFEHGKSADTASYNSIFSFGDSYSDTGNFDILLNGIIPYINFEHLPYGITYFNNTPTGRGCDGRLVLDFIAQALGLPLVPASFKTGQDFSKGANFAVIGATALDLSFFQQHNISGVPPSPTSMNVQVGWFNQMKPFLCNDSSTTPCNDYLSKSLFILGEFGGNDYNFMLSAGLTIDQVKSYIPTVVNAISAAAISLLDQGVMHLVLPGNLPTGCIPIILTLYASPNKSDYDNLGCLKEYNTIGIQHNILLGIAVAKLRGKYPNARISYAGYGEPLLQFLRVPKQYGFATDAPLRVCCGGGGPYNYNLTAACGSPNVSVACANPSTAIMWDGIHLTEAAYGYIADGWLKGPYANPPILMP
ncbi:hypothetical protein LUZ60_009739 [Juncus effusus]|nr:hypothetical protein LUZ60_009739 [Juncus effusus]